MKLPSWLVKLSRQIHWISSAACFVMLLFFSITGITLNHPNWFTADSQHSLEKIDLSTAWQKSFSQSNDVEKLSLITLLLKRQWGLPIPRNIDKEDDYWVLDYQKPGGVITVEFDLSARQVTKEEVSDGLISIINDLHKGRHSGAVWAAVIDIVAITCLLFAVTGLVLLMVHASKRRQTWPLMILGALLPLMIYYFNVP